MRRIPPRLRRRRTRIREKLSGTPEVPRICVFRSNRFLFVQAIDDTARKTLTSIHTKSTHSKGKSTKSDASFEAGKQFATLLAKEGIKSAVFDRNRYVYSGRIQRFAQGLREAGLQV